MFELKRSEAWYSPTSVVVPTTNLTPAECKKLAERDKIIDAVDSASHRDRVHVKLNTGIFKGTIFATELGSNERWPTHIALSSPASEPSWRLYDHTKGKDPTKGWKFADRRVTFSTHPGRELIKIGGNTIYPEFVGGEHGTAASILFGYDGDDVFCLDEKKRPPTFTDRLNQEVGVGDIVVVALNYGAGLEVSQIKGFTDERRVLIEMMETGERDRIPLENNATRKIMKMPYKLNDLAMMMKLAR